MFREIVAKMRNRFTRPQVVPQKSEVEWVVNSLGELGVRIFGQCFFLYKGESLQYSSGADVDDMKVRRVQKREFGEVCRPLEYAELWSSHPHDTALYDGAGWESLFPSIFSSEAPKSNPNTGLPSVTSSEQADVRISRETFKQIKEVLKDSQWRLSRISGLMTSEANTYTPQDIYNLAYYGQIDILMGHLSEL